MKLKEIRIAAGVSQERLATELGLHFTTVSKWETGKTPVPHYHYKKIAEILQMAEYEFAMLLEEADDRVDLSGWETRVFQNKKLPLEIRYLLVAVKGLADPGTGVVSTTFEQVADRISEDPEWVKEQWPALLSSGLVRQLGPIQTVLKLLI